MARFPRTGFSALSFPSFRGVTSQLVIANVVVDQVLAAHLFVDLAFNECKLGGQIATGRWARDRHEEEQG